MLSFCVLGQMVPSAGKHASDVASDAKRATGAKRGKTGKSHVLIGV